jgi:hypothetical protein
VAQFLTIMGLSIRLFMAGFSTKSEITCGWGENRRGEERRGEERRDNQQTYEENHMKQTQISQQQKVFCSCDTGGKGGTKRRAVNGNSVSQPQVCVCPTNRILEDSPDHSKL